GCEHAIVDAYFVQHAAEIHDDAPRAGFQPPDAVKARRLDADPRCAAGAQYAVDVDLGLAGRGVARQGDVVPGVVLDRLRAGATARAFAGAGVHADAAGAVKPAPLHIVGGILHLHAEDARGIPEGDGAASDLRRLDPEGRCRRAAQPLVQVF